MDPAPAPPPRRRRLGLSRLIGPALVGLGLGLAAAHALVTTLPPHFTADALIGLDASAEIDLTLDERLANTRDFRARVLDRLPPPLARASVVRPADRALLEAVRGTVTTLARRLAGPSSAEEAPPAAVLEPTAAALRLEAEAASSGRALTLTAEAATPEAARALTETAADALLSERLERRRAQLERRLAATEAALLDSRAAIVAAERRLAEADPGRLDAARARLAELEERLARAATRRAVLDADLAALRAAARPPRDLEPLLAQPRSHALARAVAARAAAAAQRRDLSRIYGERHPVMRAAEADLRAREVEVAAAAAALVDAVADAAATQADIVARLRASRDARAFELEAREADRAALETLRARLARDRERAAALAAARADLAGARATLLPDARRLATGDAERVHALAPPAGLYLGGAGGGLLLGGLLGAARRSGGHTAVAGADELDLPLLARLHRPGGRSGSDAAALERLALRLEGAAQPARSLAVVPAGVAAGVAPTALGLAHALAREGRTVLFVEATGGPSVVPRAQRPDADADADADGGLDAVLAGRRHWSEVARQDGAAGPWLLAASARRRAESDAPRLDGLLAEAGRRFDRIVVAAPPATTPAGLRAARAAQATLLLAGRRRDDALTRTVAALHDVGARPLGVLRVA